MIGPDAHRRALGRFATGVALVTATVDGEPLGLVVNSLASVSLRPPLVSFCPSRGSGTWKRMRAAGRFGINVLGDHHEAFVRRAAAPGADRFDGLAHRTSAGGVPLVADALVVIECAAVAEHTGGDHWIVVAQVEAVHPGAEAPPLVFWNGRFRALRDASPERGGQDADRRGKAHGDGSGAPAAAAAAV